MQLGLLLALIALTRQFPCALAEDPPFLVVAVAGNACPSNYDRLGSEVACRAAAHRADDEDLFNSDVTFQGDEDVSSWPAGCYSCDSVGGCSNGVWWNAHATGSSNGGARPLCGDAAFVTAGKTLFLGDSDVDYWPNTSLTVSGSYNVGIGGNTCADTKAMVSPATAVFAPSSAVLVCGENDLAYGKSVQNSFQDFKEVVSSLLASGVQKVVYMGTKKEPATTELHAKYAQYDEKIRAWAAVLRAAAQGNDATLPAPLTMVDVSGGFEALGNPGTFYDTDNLHLSSLGYSHWDSWLAATLEEEGNAGTCVEWRSGVCVNPDDGGGGGGGFCFSGDSTVAALDRSTGKTATRHLTEVKVGDLIQAVGGADGRRWAAVAGIGSSKSSGFFREITMMPHAGKVAFALRATEHHSFPLCSKKARARGVAKASKAVKAAKDLHPGDCLLTAEGERTIASVKRRAAGPGDTTYTVTMEGATDLILVGGVVTHAKPSSRPAPAKEKKRGV